MEHLVTASVVFMGGKTALSRKSCNGAPIGASTGGSWIAGVEVHRFIKEFRMHVRIAVAVFVGVVICSAAVPAAAAPILPTIFLSPASASVAVGDTFSVDVNVSDVEDLYGFWFDFNFDPLLLTPLGVTEGSFLSQGVSGSTDFQAGTHNGTGTIEFTLGFVFGPVTGVSGSGTLATFAFAATGSGSAALSLSGLLLENSQAGQFQDATTITGAVVDINASPVPEPASAASLMLMGIGLAILARRRVARWQR